jgi:hypothetical protein
VVLSLLLCCIACGHVFFYHLFTLFLIMIGQDLSIADWNTRGLNDQGRKDTVMLSSKTTPATSLAFKKPSWIS